MCEIIRLKEAFSLYITYCNRGRLHTSIQTMHLRIVGKESAMGGKMNKLLMLFTESILFI